MYLKFMRDCQDLIKEDPFYINLKNQFSKGQEVSSRESKILKLLETLSEFKLKLVTEESLKHKIIESISQLNQDNLVERILSSYFYLLIGNSAKSDDILDEIIKTHPWKWWSQTSNQHFDKAIMPHFSHILNKMSSHPSERIYFQLLLKYSQLFFNDPELQKLIATHLDNNLLKKISSSSRINHLIPHFKLIIGKAPDQEKENKNINLSTDYKLLIRYIHEQNGWKSQDFKWKTNVSEFTPELMVTYRLMSYEDLFVDTWSLKMARNVTHFFRQSFKDLYKKNKNMLVLYWLIELGEISVALEDNNLSL